MQKNDSEGRTTYDKESSKVKEWYGLGSHFFQIMREREGEFETQISHGYFVC